MKRDRTTAAETRLRESLRKRREELGWSQLRLSLLLDGTRTFVSKYESGERYLTFTEVIKLCGILELDAAALAAEIAALTPKATRGVSKDSSVGVPRYL